MSVIGKRVSGTPHREALVPEKKPETIIHPVNTPRTICNAGGYPGDFNQFEYAGTTVELVALPTPEGNVMRRPALVARMVRKRSAGDTFVEEEMTASIRDLQNFVDPKTGIRGYHDTRAVTAALNIFYENKVPLHQQEAAYAQMARTDSADKEIVADLQAL